MKIAFWSEERQAETTYHTALVACASALMFPVRAVVVSGGYNGKELERNFPVRRRRPGQRWNTGWKLTELGNTSVLKQDFRRESGSYEASVLERETAEAGVLAAEQQGYIVSRGLDCLLGKQAQELTEQVILENVRQVVKGRLYCLPGSRRQEQEWWHEDPLFTSLKQVIDGVENCFDVMFVDCGSREDDFARNILKEADVCVLNMTQEEERIGDYFRNPPKWRGKTFFLVGNYFPDGLYTRKNLERLYRIDENLLGAVPYNPQLQAAGRTGRTDSRLKEYIGKGPKGKNVEFEQELIRTTRLILKLAGVIS
jgi:hypothetical protein